MDDVLGINIQLPVGIAFAFAIDEDVLYPLPGTLFQVVAVQNKVTPAGSSRAVGKEQIAVGQPVEFRVGDVRFVMTGHRFLFS